MCLPFTSHGKHESSCPHAYTQLTGSVHGIAYVFAPFTPLSHPGCTSAYDSGVAKLVDHFGAQCSLCVPIKSICRAANVADGNQNYAYDPTAFPDPVKREQLGCAISFCDHDALSANSASRNHYIFTSVCSSLSEHIPLGERSPIKSWVSNAPPGIIKERRSHRSQSNIAKLTGVPSSLVDRLVGKFKAASRTARICLRDDCRKTFLLNVLKLSRLVKMQTGASSFKSDRDIPFSQEVLHLHLCMGLMAFVFVIQTFSLHRQSISLICWMAKS